MTPQEAAKAPPWTSEEDSILREMAAAGKTKKDVAVALGRTVNAIQSRAQVKHVRWRYDSRQIRKTADILTSRVCLLCKRSFETPYKTVFVCHICHESEEWRAAVPEYGFCA